MRILSIPLNKTYKRTIGLFEAMQTAARKAFKKAFR